MSDNWVYGTFYYEHPIKEMSDAWGAAHIKQSLLTVRKYKKLNDAGTRHQAFNALIGMACGDHSFTYAWWDIPKPPGQNAIFGGTEEFDLNSVGDLDDDAWYLPNCKTPILSMLRLIADESPSPRWNDGTTVNSGTAATPFHVTSPYFIEATDNVMSFSHSWSASNWWEIEHTGTLQFYLNDSMAVDNNVTSVLLALQNKNFYVEIWAGYSPCIGANWDSCSRQRGFYKLFTGIAQGGQVEKQYGKNIMTSKVVDYTHVLRSVKIFNSPWFDGMKDINAINEIMRMGGFRGTGGFDPLSLISALSDYADRRGPNVFFHHFDGRLFKMEAFALPSGYSRLEQPGFKFKDGQSLMDAITDISKKSAKTFYFDEFGIAHYENVQDMIEADYLGKVSLAPLFQFSTNPEIIGGQIVFNKVERGYDMATTTNHIKIMSNTPDMHLIIKDALDWGSVENPEQEGFLGYIKTLYQQEGMFGSLRAVVNAIRKYKVTWRPKVNLRFETYGLPLRANDMITLDGEVSRVMKVNHSLNAQSNRWWMEVECMRYQPVKN